MRFKRTQKHTRTLYLVLAISFASSLFYCGDADCLTGSSDENCASLLCSLLSKHNVPPANAANGDAQDCSCVCHLPIVLAPVFSLSYHPIAHDNTLVANPPLSSAHNRLVYHPPALV